MIPITHSPAFVNTTALISAFLFIFSINSSGILISLLSVVSNPIDVIIEFDGMSIKGVDHLRNNVSISKPNTYYNLTVIRDSRKKSFKVKLEKMPSDDQLAESNQTENVNELGMEVGDINSFNRREYNLDAKDEGIVVAKVLLDGPAGKAGIQSGDIITRVGSVFFSL